MFTLIRAGVAVQGPLVQIYVDWKLYETYRQCYFCCCFQYFSFRPSPWRWLRCNSEIRCRRSEQRPRQQLRPLSCSQAPEKNKVRKYGYNHDILKIDCRLSDNFWKLLWRWRRWSNDQKLADPRLKYIQTNLFFHFFQDGSDHGDVLVSRVGGRGFRLLPTEAEEHEDENHRHVDQDDEWEEGVWFEVVKCGH